MMQANLHLRQSKRILIILGKSNYLKRAAIDKESDLVELKKESKADGTTRTTIVKASL